MEQRTVTITLEKAREWYYNGNYELRALALKAYSENDLKTYSFEDITCFEDALKVLGYSEEYKVGLKEIFRRMTLASNASVAMFKLNIIRRALNNGYGLRLTENSEGQNHTWYPCFRLIATTSTYYMAELKNGEYKKLGEIISEGVTYDVLGGSVYASSNTGLGYFNSYYGVGNAYADIGFLGCASKDIAKHFGEHFGMLIMEAMYGDMVDFKIIE